jgi:hypothetical protein
MPRLSKKQEANVVTAAQAGIERQQAKSKQPRFDTKSAYTSFLSWLRITEMDAPAYGVNSPERDKWLRRAWKLEPHLAGVVNSVCLIDSNRGWSMTGGRNQVARYSDILHNSDGGLGYRMFMRKSSLSFWCTDVGAVTEIGRDGRGGPLRALWHVDSARCRLTGNAETPLEYSPAAGGTQRWGALDYMRVASLPSDDEAFNGLGFSAISRIVETLRLLYAVMVHDQEQVAARAPKGLLLLQGISEQQWNESLQARAENLDSMERRYYGGVQVLASMGADQVDAKLVALSQLPQNFDAEQFVSGCMFTFALAFGYDASEFWPVQFGALGRGTETEVQHQKATGKGGVDFALSWQEGLQRELPATLHWEFEQRDDQGALVEESVKQAKLMTVAEAYNAGIVQGAPLISREEARIMLAEAGIIPQEWTETEEDVTATDTEEADTEEATPSPSPDAEESPDETLEPAPAQPVAQQRQAIERALETPEVQRAMAVWPREPIVRYAYRDGRSTVRTIWTPGRRLWQGVARAKDDVLYKSGDTVITEGDVEAAIKAAKKRVPGLADLLTATTVKRV